MIRSLGLGLFAAATLSALAMTIGVGLSWQKNVFVQEYWQGGKGFYALANHTDAAVAITVAPQRGGDKLAGPWQVPARGVLEVPVDGLPAAGLLAWNLGDGSSLGLLEAPRAPTVGDAKVVVSTYGLSGSGGRDEKVWVETETPRVHVGDVITLQVKFAAPAAELMVKKEKLAGLKVVSDTLKVVEQPDGFTVDVSPVKAGTVQTVTISFTAPAAEKPAMQIVDTWLWTAKGKAGHGVTRGIVVLPK